MPNLQYIGARYVPKFYENPDTGDMTWKANVGYEPLTVVKFNDDTYTSKIPVPPTIGDPANNPIYWAKTADFNAALVALQNAVSILQNNVDNLMGRPRYILIGDSYGRGKPFYGNTGWIAAVKNILGLTEGDDVFSYAADGAGFTVGATFGSYLNQAITNLTDDQKEGITDIFVAGGYNDIGSSYSDTVAAIKDFCDDAALNFPHAKITIAFNCAYDATINAINGINFIQTKGYYAYADGRARIVPDLYSVLLSKYGLIGSDGIHPTAEGYQILATVTAQALLGSEVGDVFYEQSMGITPAANINLLGTQANVWRRTKNTIKMWFSPFRFQNQDASDTNPVTTYKKLGTLTNIAFDSVGSRGHSSELIQFTVADSANNIFDCVGDIAIDNNDLYLKFDLYKAGGTAYNWNEIAFIQGRFVNPEFTINADCI